MGFEYLFEFIRNANFFNIIPFKLDNEQRSRVGPISVRSNFFYKLFLIFFQIISIFKLIDITHAISQEENIKLLILDIWIIIASSFASFLFYFKSTLVIFSINATMEMTDAIGKFFILIDFTIKFHKNL